jgi:type I restriction enzyme M protein
MTNFGGYDIAPDMVRLSRVNMYLHGFPNPLIHEYDALTSEERWDERCDVIMANPPFMTPKGGIRPHNRFAVKAKRSEVLFVDYIAEHLNSGGRAGVIVPEGIIFKSQNAYRALRKMLVENYLWAVVSLPAGVFNPYSGVKTSILFLDRNLARRTEDILFVKVQNDGFDLGAQRKPIEKNNLPQALKIIDSHKKTQKVQNEGIALTVSRKRLLESGDMNLSGDRYRETAAIHSKWPMVKLGDVCTSILSGGTPSTKIAEYWEGNIPWITSADIISLKEVKPRKFITEEAIRASATNLIPANNVIVVTRVGLGKLLVNGIDLCISQDSQGLLVNRHIVDPAYLGYILSEKVLQFKTASRGSTIQGVIKSQLIKLEIPLPPLDVQQRIVEELEAERALVESNRKLIEVFEKKIQHKLAEIWGEEKLDDA